MGHFEFVTNDSTVRHLNPPPHLVQMKVEVPVFLVFPVFLQLDPTLSFLYLPYKNIFFRKDINLY